MSDFFNTADAYPEGLSSSNISLLTYHPKSKTKTHLITVFCKESGLEAIMNIIQNEDDKSRVPFGFLNHLMLYDITEYLDSTIAVPFFKEFNDSILRRIDIISDLELKDLKYEEIISLINRMKKYRTHELFNYEIYKLNFFLKMLKSVYLEKRIKALIEISNTIEAVEVKITSLDHLRIKNHQELLKN